MAHFLFDVGPLVDKIPSFVFAAELGIRLQLVMLVDEGAYPAVQCRVMLHNKYRDDLGIHSSTRSIHVGWIFRKWAVVEKCSG